MNNKKYINHNRTTSKNGEIHHYNLLSSADVTRSERLKAKGSDIVKNKYSNKTRGKKRFFKKPNPVYFMHNLNIFLIVLIVLFHSLTSYTMTFSKEFKWDIEGDYSYEFLDTTAYILNVYIMPMLFFVTGYFSIGSLVKNGNLHYITLKFNNLLLPGIFGYVFINSFPNFMQQIVNQDSGMSILFYWKNSYISDFKKLLLSNHVTIHLWFLIITFIFSLFIITINILNKDIFKRNYLPSAPSLFLAFIGVAISTIACIFLGQYFETQGKWKDWLYLISSDPSRIPIYIVYFTLGIIAYKKRWIQNLQNVNVRFWYLLSLTAITIEIFSTHDDHIINFSKHTAQYIIVHNLFLFCILMSLISFFYSNLNYTTKLLNALFRNSLVIYIIHFNIVVGMQYILLDLYIPTFIKLPIVFLVSMGLSFVISEFFLRKIFKKLHHIHF